LEQLLWWVCLSFWSVPFSDFTHRGCRSTLCKIPENRRSHLYHGGSLKSRIITGWWYSGRVKIFMGSILMEFVGPLYANSEGDSRARKIQKINIQNMFFTNLLYIALLCTPAHPPPEDRAPCSCIECDILKTNMLIIAVNTIPALLFSTQSYWRGRLFLYSYSFIQYPRNPPK
jgi:hypothetical protein